VQSFCGFATSVSSDGSALALLIVGCVLSALLGLVVFLLGGGRAPVVEPRKPSAPVPPPPAKSFTIRSRGSPTAR